MVLLPSLSLPGVAAYRRPSNPPLTLGRESRPLYLRLCLARRCAQRCGAYARANCVVPRAKCGVAGLRRAVAGLIKTNIARNSIQSNPTAAAAAKIVVTTSVAKCSMAIMLCLPSLVATCDTGRCTPTAALNALKIKDLFRRQGRDSVWGHTRRGRPDAHLACTVGRTRKRSYCSSDTKRTRR